MNIRYDSKLKRHKTPFGCIRQQEPCTITIDLPVQSDVLDVTLALETENGHFYTQYPMERLPEQDGFVSYHCTFALEECGLFYYFFQAQAVTHSFNIFKDGTHGTTLTGCNKWQLTCFHRAYTTPPDFQGKVMYQIFPDRFYASGLCNTDETDAQKGKLQPFSIHENKHDTPVYYPDHNGVVQNNDFYGGNLRGIIEKLPYLQTLHVGILYLNPIFMAYSNHRYDTADYKRIDPLLGSEEDFAELCTKAHACGMKVILDGVFSHTGCNSVYFDKYGVFGNGAYLNVDSPYRDWYQFNPTNPHDYTSWWGIDTLPCTVELDDGFLDFIIRGEDSVAAHWLNLGADGYRLDVADELPDAFIAMLHERMKELKPDSILIGEVWEDASNKISYDVRKQYFTNMELDSIMNYPYKDAIIGFLRGDHTAEQLADTVMTIAENYPKPVLDCLMNILGTHDTARILTVLGTDNFSLRRDEKADAKLDPVSRQSAEERLKAAAFLQFTLPGSPCIYYGDEAGSEGFEDPFNRRYFPWDSIDTGLNAFYQQLTKIKTDYSALQTGTIEIISCSPGVLVFSRTLNGQKMIAFVNLREEYECFTSHEVVLLQNGTQTNGHLVLRKNGFLLLRVPDGEES